jgi:hypothetical protein
VHEGYLIPTIKELHSSAPPAYEHASSSSSSSSSSKAEHVKEHDGGGGERGGERGEGGSRMALFKSWEEQVEAVRASGAFAIHYHRAADSEGAASLSSSETPAGSSHHEVDHHPPPASALPWLDALGGLGSASVERARAVR